MTRPVAAQAAQVGGAHRLREPRRVPWGLLLVCALFIMLALAYLWLHAIAPSDGSHLRPGSAAITAEGLVVTPLRELSSGLEDGDLVVAVAGQSVEEWARQLFAVGADRPLWRAGDTVAYEVMRDGARLEVPVVLDRYPLGLSVQRTWGTILFALVYLPVAAFVFLRRPELAATKVLFVSGAALFGATTWSLGAQVSDFVHVTGFWLFQATTILAFMVYWTTIFHFALVFPRPLAVAKRPWLIALAYTLPFVLLGGYLLLSRLRSEGTLEWIASWGPTTSYHAAVFLTLALFTVARQYRIHRSGVGRQQLQWVVFAALVAGGAGLILYILPPIFGAAAVSPNFIGLVALLFPVALAVAVLRHNLFDIDTILNRALVYGALTITIIILYVLIVGALGAALQTQANLYLALVATGLVAVLFEPLKGRLQQGVNRLMYGERDVPQTVLSRLGKRLEEAATPNSMLQNLVQTIAQALKLPYVALVIGRGEGSSSTITYGRARHPSQTFPLTFQGEAVGVLEVEPRGRDEPFTKGEVALIEAIAAQAGVAAYAARLNADLQQSRERLVSAREEERRRLRSDLHDGIGPALAGLTLRLDAAYNVLGREPKQAEAILKELRPQVQALIEDLRRLIYGLRPPALDQLGLIGALREQAAIHQSDELTVRLSAHAPLPELPAAVEVAAYRIVQEALTNVLRHSEATACHISLKCDGELEVEVTDNGRGLKRPVKYGVGLSSMRERAAELGGTFTIEAATGGGTRVRARLPVVRR